MLPSGLVRLFLLVTWPFLVICTRVVACPLCQDAARGRVNHAITMAIRMKLTPSENTIISV